MFELHYLLLEFDQVRIVVS